MDQWKDPELRFRSGKADFNLVKDCGRRLTRRDFIQRSPFASPTVSPAGARMQGGSTGIVYGGLKYQASTTTFSKLPDYSPQRAPFSRVTSSSSSFPLPPRPVASPTCAQTPGPRPSSPEPSASRRRTRCVWVSAHLRQFELRFTLMAV
jgi:hypothetical protein